LAQAILAQAVRLPRGTSPHCVVLAPMSSEALQGDYDERHTDENHPYDGSGLAPRACTDVFCLAVFVAFVAGMGCVVFYSFQNGHIERLTHGFNYKGELCGVHEAVRDKHLIYWCGAGTVQESGIPSSLDLRFPTCVSRCPADIYTEMACLGVEQVQVDTSGRAPFIVERTTITQSTVKQMSYPTMELAGLYCIPHLTDLNLPGDDPLTKSLMGPAGPLGNPWAKLVTSMGALHRSWPVVASTMVVAVVLGYAYLLLLRCYAKLLVEVTLFLLTVGFLLTGSFFLFGGMLTGDTLEKWQTNNSIFHQFDMDTAAWYSRLVGVFFTLFGLAMLCAVCCAQDAIRNALGCIEVAIGCIFTMPSMLAQPVIEATWKLCVASFLIYGFMLLLSTADMRPDFIKVERGEEVGGLTRSLTFSDAGKAMVVYYVIGFFWLMELANAMSQFVISYSVVLWYYTAKPKGFGPNIPLVRGFIVGAVFHLGTLAMGAFLIASCRFPRMILGYITKQAKIEGSNKACEMLGQCLQCCTAFSQRYLEYMNKNAYIDVCISSTNFCTAAKNSFGFIASEGGKVMMLTGACSVFCLAGVVGIASACGALTYLMVSSSEGWTSDTSEHHVASPYFVAVVAALLAGEVAVCFMAVFDHTTDTLLYTYVWNKSHGHNTVQKYAPETLASLTEYKPISKPRRSMSNGPGGGGVFSAFSTFFNNSPTKGGQASLEESQSLMRNR